MCSFIDLALFDEQNREKHPSSCSLHEGGGIDTRQLNNEWINITMIGAGVLGKREGTHEGRGSWRSGQGGGRSQ